MAERVILNGTEAVSALAIESSDGHAAASAVAGLIGKLAHAAKRERVKVDWASLSIGTASGAELGVEGYAADTVFFRVAAEADPK